jgi:16S rRNA (guanine966-N2)-methyltransferase
MVNPFLGSADRGNLLAMRIVAGKHRGRRIAAPEGHDVRPTSDRAREALFNILEHGHFTADGTSPLIEARVLDVFAGSGALGLEALSRGAAHVTCIESNAAARSALRANAKALGETARVTVVQADATKPPTAAGPPCGLVLMDPPYRSGLAAPALAALAERGWLAGGAICVVEISAAESLDAPPGFAALDERRYGKAKLVFLRYDPPTAR